MKGSPNIARTAALIGDVARASMLTALMSGKALTASELSREAGVTIQTASSHLSKLEQGGLLKVRKQGRNKYFALASQEVANVLEALMGLEAGNSTLKTKTGPKDEALRHARVCYNHLAGDMGIKLYDSLLAQQYLAVKNDELVITCKGHSFATDFGIDIPSLQISRTPLCRECLDWSERRSHLAGSLGRAFLQRFEALRWVKREDASRVIRFSRKGTSAFDLTFPTN